MKLFRGASYTGQPIYVLSQPVFPNDSTILASFEGSDYNVPAPANEQLIYSCFATFVPESASEQATRLGPVCFNAVAYSDD
ncbi:hypothetical protein [Paenibacillus sp. 7523-1]|uniref:hypothetical protein n=1 Tax=Paenibacillus sp. 7523-1 TaxID=2022550 RepID=UPI0015961C3F|nr:hypothetical protein [Paenibacillus sp. 7523-1]